VTSAQTAAVANVNDAPVGVPTISGTVTEDQTLTAVTTGISDADGLGPFSYQWRRNGVAVGGATSTTYVLGDADVGTQISVQVSYTDGQGTAESVTSAQTAAVVNVNDSPLLQRNQPLDVNEGGVAVLDASHLFATDVDARADELTYVITNATASGQLQSTAAPGVALTRFTQAEIDAGLLQYVHDSSETLTDTFTFTVSDPQGATIGSVSFQIVIHPQNDAPVIQTASASGLIYKGGLQTVDPSIGVTDSDSATITEAVVRISGQYMKGDDRLILSGTHPLLTQWNAEKGTLTLSGAASADIYASALSAVQFASLDTLNKFREIVYSVSDGSLSSNVLQKNVELGYMADGKSGINIFPLEAVNSVNSNAKPGDSTFVSTENKIEVDLNKNGLVQPILRDKQDSSLNLLENQPIDSNILFENTKLSESSDFENQASLLVQRQRSNNGQYSNQEEDVGSRKNEFLIKEKINFREILEKFFETHRFDADFMDAAASLSADGLNYLGLKIADFKINEAGIKSSLGMDVKTSANADHLLDERGQLGGTSERAFNFDILSEPGVAGGLLVSSVVLWWATRTGGLLAAMMVSVPAWRSFDPLPILARARSEQEEKQSFESDSSDTTVDNSRFSGELSLALRFANLGSNSRSIIEELSGLDD
jgi:hypothetical protein